MKVLGTELAVGSSGVSAQPTTRRIATANNPITFTNGILKDFTYLPP
jgi:hypothetical protein